MILSKKINAVHFRLMSSVSQYFYVKVAHILIDVFRCYFELAKKRWRPANRAQRVKGYEQSAKRSALCALASGRLPFSVAESSVVRMEIDEPAAHNGRDRCPLH